METAPLESMEHWSPGDRRGSSGMICLVGEVSSPQIGLGSKSTWASPLGPKSVYKLSLLACGVEQKTVTISDACCESV